MVDEKSKKATKAKAKATAREKVSSVVDAGVKKQRKKIADYREQKAKAMEERAKEIEASAKKAAKVSKYKAKQTFLHAQLGRIEEGSEFEATVAQVSAVTSIVEVVK